VQVIAAATIYMMFACFLVFPMLGLPATLHRSAMTLLAAELVALGLHSYFGGIVAAAGRSVATIDIPLLSVALLTVAVTRGVRFSQVSENGRPPEPRERFAGDQIGGPRDRAAGSDVAAGAPPSSRDPSRGASVASDGEYRRA
jgi:hypothetical protein